jgi:hypothetical protein
LVTTRQALIGSGAGAGRRSLALWHGQQREGGEQVSDHDYSLGNVTPRCA